MVYGGVEELELHYMKRHYENIKFQGKVSTLHFFY